MTDNPENLVLTRLRDIRSVLDIVVGKLDEITTRIGHVERSAAQQALQLAEMNVRLDGMEKRITRMEVRLELVEPSHNSATDIQMLTDEVRAMHQQHARFHDRLTKLEEVQ